MKAIGFGWLLLLPLLAAAAEPFTVELRGLGRIEAREQTRGQVTRTLLTAETPELAMALASKLVADFTGFGDLRPAPDSKLPGTVLTGNGCWLIGVTGRHVTVIYAPTFDQLRQLAAGIRVEPVKARAYPRWLDRFDNDAVSLGTLGWGILPKDYRNGLRWMREIGLNLVVDSNNPNLLAAPGVFDLTVARWAAHEAQQLNGAYHLYLPWSNPERPAWLWNQTPLPYYRPEEGYVAHHSMGYQKIASASEFEPAPATDAAAGAAQSAVTAELARDPAFSAHFAAPELGHHSVLSLSVYAESPEAKAAWVEFLKTVRRYDPAEVGRRYCGDAGAFRSLEEVPFPTLRTFAGYEPGQSLDLRGRWELNLAPATDWVPFELNDPLLLLYRNYPQPVRLRRTFTLTEDQVRDLKYLHFALNGWHGSMSRSFEVELNGRKLKNLTAEHPLTGDYDQCFELGEAAKAGVNTIVLDTRGQVVPGYAFLGSRGRWTYPSPDPQLNARFFDAVEFAAYYRVKGLEHWLKAFRRGDPEGRPLLVMAPGDFIDLTYDLFKRYGAYPHETGQGGAIWAPWVTRYYAAHDLPISSEPGNAPHTAADMQNMMTLYALMGDEAVTWLFDPIQYQVPEIDAWIRQNREQIRAIGKLEPAPPAVGVLRSVRNASRLAFSNAPWSLDPSRGDLYAAGFTSNVIDPVDLVKDRANDRFPVIFDACTELWTPEELAGLRRYLERGGVFITVHETGKHTPEQAYSWPISELSKLKVVNHHQGTGGKIRFTDTQTLFPSLRGKEINSWGLVYDWPDGKPDPAVEVVAEWVGRAPGSGKIAIARTRVGKGELISNSGMWRNPARLGATGPADPGARPYLIEMLTSLGVPRGADKGDGNGVSDLFLEHRRSKNGLYDVYLAAKVRREGTTETELVFPRELRPESLRELSALKHPATPFRYADGKLTIPGVKLGPMQLRLFGAPRPDRGSAPSFWLKSLAKRFPALPELPPEPAFEFPDQDRYLGLNQNWTMVADNQPWGATPPADFQWNTGKTVELGAFPVLGLPDETVAHFRREVEIPPAWKGSRVSLNFSSQYWFWGLMPAARLWINGKPWPNAQTRLGGAPNNSFGLDLPDSGRVVLELEIDGRLRPDQNRVRPSGVTGVFYLASEPQPLKREQLTDWQAAEKRIGEFKRTLPDIRTRFIYLEKRFPTPDGPEGAALYLESPAHLGWLMINGTVISTPGWMRKLDVSGLLKPVGQENVIRWWPELCKEEPSFNRVLDQKVPRLYLSWIPKSEK